MRILEVILEGFKSYPHRTVFKNFDHSFNAITGLNGSGKSNFLDAIIFVLGISKNLQMLRITKLSELIYKNAMGNISKAEVTVVFDNSDHSNQPIGYEDCPIITVTRIIESDKSKYYINGKSAKLKNYKEMFRQVKLSIESPSFIVTQGRISKIITLKPKELLEMIEDTVGTLFFRSKKAEVSKGVDKEMEQFMDYGQRVITNIGPQLVKIRADIDIRAKIDKLTIQIESIEKKIVAVGVEYHNQKIKQIISEQEKFSRNLEQSQKHEVFLKNKLKDCEEKIDKRKKQEEKYLKLQEYQLQTTQDSKQVRSLQNNFSNTQKELQKQDQLYKIRQEQKIEIMREIESAQNLIPQVEQQIIDLEDNIKSKRDDQERIQFSSDQDQRQLVGDNIAVTTQELNIQNNKLKQIRDNLNRQNEKARQRVQLRALSQNEITQLTNKMEQLQPKKQELLNQIAPLKDLENQLKVVNTKLINQTHQLKMLRQEKDQPEFNSINISEQVRKILPSNFDSNCFDTLVTKCRFKQQLFEQYKYVINESMLGSLGTVICDNTEQSSILCKCSFQLFSNRSVTIQTKADFNNQYALSQQVEQQIRKDAINNKQKLIFLWELLDIDVNYKKFFDKQFQQQVIIENLKENDFGKYLASHYGLRVFNPEGDLISDGIVSGGYRGESQVRTRNADLIHKFHSILDKIENLKISIQKLENERDELAKNQTLLNQHEAQLQEIMKIIEKTSKEIERQEQILSENALQQLNDDIYLLEEEEIQYQNKIKECEKQLKEYTDQLKLCQGGQKQMKRIDFEIDDLKKQLFKKQKQKDEFDDLRRNKERQLKDLEEELIKLEADKKELNQSLNSQKNLLKEKQLQLEERLIAQTAQKDQLDGPEEMNIDDLQEQIKQIQIEIRYLQQERPAIIQEIYKYKEEIKFNQNQIQEIKQHQLYQQTSIEIIQGKLKIDIQENLSQYEYLKEQIVNFKENIKNLQQQLNFKRLSQKQIEISQNFENIGKEIQTVFNSANKLREELDECEQIREATVRRCVAKVSQDFSMIFNTLYPQATAELRGIGEIFTENGLEVIIKMEGKEKPLSQLSGGQKSLLAVALLMAQLRYFPSPFYLLDEIDSALDIEHTEKLGLIFATHFKTAQFILISLKSQMFKCAPVIFSVSQTAGVSSIQREEGKNDERALQKQLKGYNINMEEHQQNEEKRFQQLKSRKNKPTKGNEQIEEEQAKEDAD